jgi:hypothetical protein
VTLRFARCSFPLVLDSKFCSGWLLLQCWDCYNRPHNHSTCTCSTITATDTNTSTSTYEIVAIAFVFTSHVLRHRTIKTSTRFLRVHSKKNLTTGKTLLKTMKNIIYIKICGIIIIIHSTNTLVNLRIFTFCAKTPPKISKTKILKPHAINSQVSCRLRLRLSDMLKRYCPISNEFRETPVSVEICHMLFGN